MKTLFVLLATVSTDIFLAPQAQSQEPSHVEVLCQGDYQAQYKKQRSQMLKLVRKNRGRHLPIRDLDRINTFKEIRNFVRAAIMAEARLEFRIALDKTDPARKGQLSVTSTTPDVSIFTRLHDLILKSHGASYLLARLEAGDASLSDADAIISEIKKKITLTPSKTSVSSELTNIRLSDDLKNSGTYGEEAHLRWHLFVQSDEGAIAIGKELSDSFYFGLPAKCSFAVGELP